MTYIVTITSQGQISIPAVLRKELNLSLKDKALVKREGQRIIIEPIPDLLSFRGSLSHKAMKGKSIDEIIALEERAVEEAIVERYKRSLKNIKR